MATLLRNGWLLWSGLGGYFAPEYADYSSQLIFSSLIYFYLWPWMVVSAGENF